MKIINKIITILIIFLLLGSFENIVNNIYAKGNVPKVISSNLNIPTESTEAKIEVSKEKSTTKDNYKAILKIPKLNLERGFYDSSNTLNNVDYNVTLLEPKTFTNVKDSLLVLAAHSGTSRISYFHNLNLLDSQDKVYIDFANVEYTYEVDKKYEIDKDGTLEIYEQDKGILYLTTCSEENKTKQLVIVCKLVREDTY